jgi:hypothetical protein
MQMRPQAVTRTCGDENVAVVEGVGEVRQAGVRFPRRCVDVGGALHVERLVRALGVELSDEVIEAGLLLEAIGAWRADGLLLEGQVHALMAPVLLRSTWLDALNIDAEPQPPDGELGEVEQGVWASEGNAVIGADGIGQAALAEQPIEGRGGEILTGRLQGLA